MKLSLVALLLVVLSPIAHADDFVTEAEIAASGLNEAEQGMLAGTLLTAPVIECLSTNEGIGADSERLRIYHIEIGNVFSASVAVWKAYDQLKVYMGMHDAEALKAAYKKGETLQFAILKDNNPPVGNDLSVKFSRAIPMLGKATDLKFAASGAVAMQICKAR